MTGKISATWAQSCQAFVTETQFPKNSIKHVHREDHTCPGDASSTAKLASCCQILCASGKVGSLCSTSVHIPKKSSNGYPSSFKEGSCSSFFFFLSTHTVALFSGASLSKSIFVTADEHAGNLNLLLLSAGLQRCKHETEDVSTL